MLRWIKALPTLLEVMWLVLINYCGLFGVSVPTLLKKFVYGIGSRIGSQWEYFSVNLCYTHLKDFDLLFKYDNQSECLKTFVV